MSNNIQLDLTEFVSKLIHDTFNAITVSSKEQAEIYFELVNLASLDYDAFKQKHIKDAAIDDELANLFPTEDSTDHPHAIYKGAPYTYDDAAKRETPPLKEVLGFEVSKKQRRASSKTLLSATVDDVREAVRDLLGQQHYTAFNEIVKRGIPRVIIDSGRILAKLSLKAESTDDSDESGDTAGPEVARVEAVPSGAAAIRASASLDKTLISRNIMSKLTRTRVGVILPEPGETGPSTDASLWGEVEIHFRTVN